jgi:hypothetical protein
MDRRFLLPTLSLLGLGNQACDGSIAGDWKASEWTYDGYVYKLPEVDTYVDDGVSFTTTFGFRMSADDEGGLDIGGYYAHEGSDGSSDEQTYFFKGKWTGESKSYTLTAGQGTVSLDCTLDGDELACEGSFEDHDDTDFVFLKD